MTEWKSAVAVVVVAVMLASSLVPQGGPSGLGAASAPDRSISGGRTAAGPRDISVNYMNKTTSNPLIDGSWGANEWTKAKRYDISVGSKDQCVLYIGFDTANTRIFMGIDVPVDITQDTSISENELVLICIDGDNDGKITCKNKNGTSENESFPITLTNGTCKDRWAQIWGSGTNDAGWLNLNGSDNSIQQWRVQPYYFEATDQMRAGFSGHRFYEYSIDYVREMGLSAGASSLLGIIIRVMDGLGDNNPSTLQVRGQMPINFSTLGGPWAQFSLAQAPLAGITSPVAGGFYYQNETINMDGSASTDDAASTLVYVWSFDDGGKASNKTTAHSFATVGPHLITLDVTDADGLTNTTRTTVNIKERNVPPVIESFYPPRDPQLNETESMSFGVNVTDDNMDVGDRVNITWTINGVVKKVDLNSWTSNFTLTAQYDGNLSAGSYAVAASVVDSYDMDSHDPVVQGWTLTVLNTNRPPLVTMSSPEADALTVTENSAQEFIIDSIDPDGDEVTVQWKLDNRTIPGTRDQSSVTYSPDYNSSGVHVLKAQMTDSLGGVTERAWTVTVANVNRPPRIVSYSPSANSAQIQEGKTAMFTISAFDPDGTVPEVEWSIGEEIVEGANATSFSFRAQYEGPRSSEGSPYTLTAVIRDKDGITDERSWEITVADVNRAPLAIVDEPQDGSTIRLGNTTRFRADRSWDPDSVDNSSLGYTWNFDDGSKTSTLPVVSHKYAKPGNYTVRLTVRDRMTSSSVLVSLMVVAPVLSIMELSLDPLEGASAGKRVNIQLRVANNGDTLATDVRIRLTLDNILLTTLTIPAIERGDVQDVHWAWPAEAGSHVIRAALEPAADTVIGEGGNAQKEVTVAARAGNASPVLSTRNAMILSGGVVAGVVLLVGLAVWSRRRKAHQASWTVAPAPPAAPAAPQRVPFEQMMSPPAAAAPTIYQQFPGPHAQAPPPSPYPQFQGDTAQAPATSPPQYPQFPGPSYPAPSNAPPAPSSPVPPVPPVRPDGGSPPSQAATQVAVAQPYGMPAAASTVTAPPDRAPAVPAAACPACGEKVESGWAVCPACSTPLLTAGAATPAAPPAAAPSGAPSGEAQARSSPETSAIASSIGELGQKLDGLAAAGKDVTHARGMLDIALSFLRTGKTEKAQLYLEKTRSAISEIGP